LEAVTFINPPKFYIRMIRLVCVGKLKEQWLREGIKEYAKRLQKFDNVEIIELKDEPIGSDSEKAKTIEGKRIVEALKDDFAVALDINGKPHSSEEFASFLKKSKLESSRIAFVIGGALGLSDEAISRCNARISLSRMTFPHQMVRLVLMEQLYRAFTIISGMEYHKWLCPKSRKD